MEFYDEFTEIDNDVLESQFEDMRISDDDIKTLDKKINKEKKTKKKKKKKMHCCFPSSIS